VDSRAAALRCVDLIESPLGPVFTGYTPAARARLDWNRRTVFPQALDVKCDSFADRLFSLCHCRPRGDTARKIGLYTLGRAVVDTN
jgi:hypothetical protein